MMTVYVDELIVWPHAPAPFRTGSCHMIADTPTELTAFAINIGLKLAWRQDTGTAREHFDLTPSRRRKALRMGAVGVTSRDIVQRMRR